MRAAVVSCVAALAGCRGLLGIDDPIVAATDAPADDLDARLVDAPLCYGVTPYEVCLTQAPQGTRDDESAIIDTDADCTEIVNGWCVVAAESMRFIEINPTGSRPLVLLAATTLDVTTINAGVQTAGPGAQPAACAAGTLPLTSAKGGGGGAGGSSLTVGGAGGDGDGNQGRGGDAAPAVALAPGELRGGCAGQRGADGAGGIADAAGIGGGAVYLLAGQMLRIGSTVNMSGTGGGRGRASRSGGSGGGAGGMIVLWSPDLEGTPVLLAGGGGGGSGAGTANGQPGVTPNLPMPAAGGPSNGNTGGAGGAGGGGSMPAGPGADASGPSAGGGGGGGGAGAILIFGTNQFTSLAAMPAPQMP